MSYILRCSALRHSASYIAAAARAAAYSVMVIADLVASVPLPQAGHPPNSAFQLGQATVYVTTTADQTIRALAALRASMQDPFVAIDLEWKPGKSSSVALLQLATGAVAVLLRTKLLDSKGAAHLQAFLRDPAVTLVGFGWDGGDERQMQRSFGWGRSQFGGFLDLQCLAESLGYYQLGLWGLAAAVLGVAITKNKQVAASNWEAPSLSLEQIHYAACDVLLPWHTHRQLRQWQLGSCTCPGEVPACQLCSRRLGVAIEARWKCAACNCLFAHLGELQGHELKTKHATGQRTCSGCGRVSNPEVRRGWGQLPEGGEGVWGQQDEEQARREAEAGVCF